MYLRNYDAYCNIKYIVINGTIWIKAENSCSNSLYSASAEQIETIHCKNYPKVEITIKNMGKITLKSNYCCASV